MTVADPNHHARFLIKQRIRPMVNQYEVSTLGADEGSPGEQVCFVEQKRMKLKEDLRAFTNDSKSTEAFRIKAQQVFDPRTRYDVTDPSGQPLSGGFHTSATSRSRSPTTSTTTATTNGSAAWSASLACATATASTCRATRNARSTVESCSPWRSAWTPCRHANLASICSDRHRRRPSAR
jgi:hypothetical protein